MDLFLLPAADPSAAPRLSETPVTGSLQHVQLARVFIGCRVAHRLTVKNTRAAQQQLAIHNSSSSGDTHQPAEEAIVVFERGGGGRVGGAAHQKAARVFA
jgi:hypothetical protein